MDMGGRRRPSRLFRHLVEFLATIKLPEREVQSLMCEDEVEILLFDTKSVRSALTDC